MSLPSALLAKPHWLVEERAGRMPIVPVRLGRRGVPKQIHLGVRRPDLDTGYLRAFIETARGRM